MQGFFFAVLLTRHVNYYNVSLNPRLDQVVSPCGLATLLVSDEEKL